jgi:hypothetical protein
MTILDNPAACDCSRERQIFHPMESGTVIAECSRCHSLDAITADSTATADELADQRDLELVTTIGLAVFAACVVFSVILCVCIWAR